MKETLVISDPHPIISLIIVCKWVKLIKIGSICYLASGIFHLIKHQKSSRSRIRLHSLSTSFLLAPK